ncbi:MULTISPECIES: hypothetical protein [unclassified Bradyrhizobium]|uniref:hypothetical protein n=1 Tax=unclassified Bradyrhizobium TaxID=2631580 RepID=UPI00230529CA|nr:MULTISPECIES: hypothetical protein [unclassified Bradyrhizobium]
MQGSQASSLGHIVLGALNPAALDELLGKAKLVKPSATPSLTQRLKKGDSTPLDH